MIEKLFKYRPIYVSFVDEIDETSESIGGFYCKNIGESIKKNKKIIVDGKKQKCSGGNYFLGNIDVPLKDILDVYVNKEKVFKCSDVTDCFLKTVKKNPLKKRYIVLDPRISEEAKIVIGIVNAFQASKILGLAAYDEKFGVDIVPAISTCSCLFRPLIEKNKIHVNFIDYFDRYYRAKGVFDDNEFIISMDIKIFHYLNDNYNNSPHGGLILNNSNDIL
jgi:uncharacterized protein (DUF169 family)